MVCYGIFWSGQYCIAHGQTIVISNGNRTKWSPIRSVIVRAINKIGGALDRSDWETWSTLKKGGPLFFKLLCLDGTDPLSFGPKFPEILVEWIAHNVSNIIFFTQYPLTPSREEVLRIYKMVNKGKMLQSLLIMYVDNGLQGLTAFYFFNSAQCQEIPLSSAVSNKPSNFCRV